LADLTKLRYHIRKELHPVRIIDGFELICGNNYTREKVEQAISSGWSSDPVHPSKHVYAKTALHLLEKIAPALEKAATTVNPGSLPPGRKRTWSDSNRSEGGASGSSQRFGGEAGNGSGYGGSGYGGGGGYPTPRSQTWRDRRDSGSRGGFGGGGGGQRHFEQHSRTADGGGYYGVNEHEHGRDRQSRDRYQHWEDRSGGGGGGGYGGGYATGYGGGAGGRGGRGGRGRRN
jgi:hypothetical protein